MMNIDFNEGHPLKDFPQILEKYPIIPHSLIHPHDAKIKNTSMIKFIEIKVNDIEILLLYKFVKMMKVQFVRLLHTPISITNDIELNKRVLKLLSQHPLITQLITTQKDLTIHSLPIPKDIYAYDFYSLLEPKFVEVNKGKHKSKIKYTKYKDRIQFMKVDITHYDAISHILSAWMSNKIDTSELFNKKTFSNIQRNYPKLILDDNFLIYVTCFDNIPIAFEVLSKQGNHLYQLVNQAYPTLDYYIQLFNDYELAKEIHAYVHKWQHLLTINEFYDSYEYINYGYAQDINGGLYNFKNMLYRDRFLLYKLIFKK